ncbi:WSC-domain-containing protein [Clavulina sp. PMI_390]|nr:WSC-domain-containing protein [Clavulina sp. PMI_390]
MASIFQNLVFDILGSRHSGTRTPSARMMVTTPAFWLVLLAISLVRASPLQNKKEIIDPSSLEKYHPQERGIRTPAPVKSYGTWTYYGCTLDLLANADGLAVHTGPSKTMTPQYCMDTCNGHGFALAGLQGGDDCYCGNALDKFTIKILPAFCDFACTGNAALTCGGLLAVDVYTHPRPSLTTTFTTTYTTSRTVASLYTTTIASYTTYTGTSSVYVSEPTSTLVLVPYTYTTTVSVPVETASTAVVPITTSTTVVGDVTVSTSVYASETGTTSVEVPYTITSTSYFAETTSTFVPVPTTETLTVGVLTTTDVSELEGSTTLATPVLSTVTATTTVPIVIPSTTISSKTFFYTSFTLSIFTGTTSFIDPLTTVFQPVIILTTLAKTITTTSVRPVTLTETVSTGETTVIPTTVQSHFVSTIYTVVPTSYTTYVRSIIPTVTSSASVYTSTSAHVNYIPTSSLSPTGFTRTFETGSVYTEPTSTTSIYTYSSTNTNALYTTTVPSASVGTATTSTTSTYETGSESFLTYTTTVEKDVTSTGSKTVLSKTTVTTTVTTVISPPATATRKGSGGPWWGWW